MTKKQSHEVQCPHCGAKADFEYYATINVTLNPELKEKLLNRELGTFRCGKCRKETFVAHNILYHDMRGGFFIWLIYPQEDGSIHFEEGMDGMPVLKGMEHYKFRLVKDYNQLMEKIFVLDDKRDDIAVEIVKISLLGALQERGDVSVNTHLLYRQTERAQDGIAFAMLGPDIEPGKACSVDNDPFYTSAMKAADDIRPALESANPKSLKDALSYVAPETILMALKAQATEE
jgi:hypothetical protein